jgi:hypothetical protein
VSDLWLCRLVPSSVEAATVLIGGALREEASLFYAVDTLRLSSALSFDSFTILLARCYCFFIVVSLYSSTDCPRMNTHLMNSTMFSKPVKQRKLNELFVGDLSFFCTEAHLFELFSEFGNVEAVRIVRNDHKKRTMGFGFVTMETPQIAREVAKILNNHLFMGRIMK